MEERKTIMMTLMMMIDVKEDESDDVVGDDDNDFDEWRVSTTIMTKRPIQTTIKRISHYIHSSLTRTSWLTVIFYPFHKVWYT